MLTMVFVLAFGIDTINAQDKHCQCPCDCIKLVEDAVKAVMETSYCDLYGFWKIPDDLDVHLKKLQNWCETVDVSLKSDFPDSVDDMLETIHYAIEGKSYTLNDVTFVVQEPAPDCAIEALLHLQTLLLYGCPVQIIE